MDQQHASAYWNEEISDGNGYSVGGGLAHINDLGSSVMELITASTSDTEVAVYRNKQNGILEIVRRDSRGLRAAMFYP